MDKIAIINLDFKHIYASTKTSVVKDERNSLRVSNQKNNKIFII